MSLTKPNHQESSYRTLTQASISKVIARYLTVQRGQNNKCFTGKLTFSGIRDNRCSQLARNWCRRVAEKLTGPRFQCPFQTDIGSFESGLQFEAPLFNCFSWNVNKFDFLIAYFAQLNKSSGVKIWLLMCRRLAPVLWVFFYRSTDCISHTFAVSRSREKPVSNDSNKISFEKRQVSKVFAIFEVNESSITKKVCEYVKVGNQFLNWGVNSCPSWDK